MIILVSDEPGHFWPGSLFTVFRNGDIVKN